MKLTHTGLALVATAGLFATAWWGPPPAAAAPGRVQWNRDIRPILSDNCFACHGPDKGRRKAKLRLDLRESALQAKAVVPGKPDASELWTRVASKDPDEVMPPPETHKQLTAVQHDLLRRWIAEGAEYQPHWAYVPVRRPEVPPTKTPRLVANPIDAFILATLEDRGIAPSPPADRRTLIRRVSLDLIGLPPTPEAVRAFIADDGPHAWEQLVDRLLASPHYGERMAIPWLDVVRFADTVGYHGDQNQNVSPYRDWVIDAFNRNQPFDQFTIDQVAGDLLPKPTTAQLVATGFHRLNMVTREGGAQTNEYLAKYAADRVRTVAQTWLGSTMGCAECHDHKFDPFSTRDFYSMAAFFADVKQWGVYGDYTYTPNPDLKGWGNDHPFPPEIVVDSPYLQARLARLRRDVAALAIDAAWPAGAARQSSRAAARRLSTWQGEMRQMVARYPDGWRPMTPTVAVDSAPTDDKAGSKRPRTTTLEFSPGPGRLASLRLDLVPRSKTDGTTVTLAAEILRKNSETPAPLTWLHADATRKEAQFRNGDEVIGITVRGWKIPAADAGLPMTGVWQLATPVDLSDGDRVRIKLKGDGVGDLRAFTSPLAAFAALSGPAPRTKAKPLAAIAGTVNRKAVLALAPRGRDARLAELYLQSSGTAAAETHARHRQLFEDVLSCRDGRIPTLVTVAWQPRVTRVLARGNWQDESGEVVKPAVPHFLPQLALADGRRANRLDLARWLVSRDNPLTARVTVNRLWKQLFGAGLSAPLTDVGAQGEPPSHPELLDWLAAELTDNAWDIKRMVKLMVSSNTYRQDAVFRDNLKDIDPGNRLLARQSPRRLEAELVRDNALATAGLLVGDIGGPSARPYQPVGYYENINFPLRDYQPHEDDRQYRRGLYMHWQRTFLHPMLANFDAPSREECTADRVVSNTPQQALTLLNDTSFVEAARALAERLVADGNAHNDEQRLTAAYERALARPPTAAERDSLLRLLGVERESYTGRVPDADKLPRNGLHRPPADVDKVELAAWTAVARVILNLHEFITRY